MADDRTYKIKPFVPAGMGLTYANHALIQTSEADVTLSFFQIPTPFGSQEELEKVDTLEAQCVVRIVLTHVHAVRLLETLGTAMATSGIIKPVDLRDAISKVER